jgi:flagellar protein FlbD
MIEVTGLDGVSMLLNVDQMTRIEQTPDTLVTMSNGEAFFVRETPNKLVDRVIRFKRAVASGPREVHRPTVVASGGGR